MRNILLLPVVLALSIVGMAQTVQQTIDDGILDHIELLQEKLLSASESVVVVRPFDASGANLGTGGKDGKQARQDEAKLMQQQGPALLAETIASKLSKGGGFKSASVATSADLPDHALIVEGTFVTIDPGSRAKRYFAGFGAGKSSVEVSGHVNDSHGLVLARFRQRRIGVMGMGGGDSLGKMMSDTRGLGEDIAKFLTAWARGEKLKD